MQIRPATAHDRAAILALMRPRDYNRINLNPSCFLVAVSTLENVANKAAQQNMPIIGIGQVKHHWNGTPELASLVVAPDYRQQGVGSALVEALVMRHFAEPMRAHAEPLYLFCLSTLEPYYQRLGFYPVARSALPWPLRWMYITGNCIGHCMNYLGGEGFRVIAMRIEPDGE